ncbi:MAG: hypothetical protein BGO51_17300 [Rhodospirillales bacterium 69-11]|nr:hypothetical protein [Rhodospirillales bacterium]OJW19547.1 MAG: hypothetical protein BGO51_17300 [Rhodospirillales bacterium 69-11]
MTAETSDQLRAKIDSGRTGDKVGVSDPAAAPLGADDEAAGTPPSGAALRQASSMEGEGPATPAATRSPTAPVLVIMGGALAVVVIGVIWALVVG